MTGQWREKLGPLKDKFRKNKCWICGTGPSLDDVDLSLLGDRRIFALNAAITLFSNHKHFKDVWWVFWDLRAYHESWNRTGRLMKIIRAFVHKRALEVTRSLRISGHYVEYEGNIFKPKRTVLETALRVVDYLGFEEVYMVGIDFAVRPMQPYATELMWKNCFFWDFKTQKECKSVVEMLEAMRAFKPELNNVKVFQTSPLFPDTELFPYIPYEDALKRTKSCCSVRP